MSVAPFLVGLTSSSYLTFLVSEGILERRLVYIEKGDRSEHKRAVYTQKLNGLLREEYQKAFQPESDIEKTARQLVNKDVVPFIASSASQAAKAINDGSQQLATLVNDLINKK